MSDIKQCFVSRFGNEGYIMEADFSQLEMIGLAYISGDEVLKQDIMDGKDFHCINASFLYGQPYEYIKEMVDAGDEGWIKKRKKAKGPGFLIVYGGGATTMAKNTGLPIEDCKNFIARYYERYIGVALWQETVKEEVESTRKPSTKRTELGLPSGVGYYTSITGRRYVFQEYDAPEWMGSGSVSFSPTQLKNYPIQGFSTGDLVPLAVGKLYRVLKNNPKKLPQDKIKLINTVHDSVLLDVHESVVEVTADVVKKVMERTPKYFEDIYKVKFDLPLPVEVSYGRTWAETK